MNDCDAIAKVKSFDIPEIAEKIISGKHHIHKSKPVPKRSLKLWKIRGYNAHKYGVIHVRYPMNDAGLISHKYIFPLYFWIKKQTPRVEELRV